MTKGLNEQMQDFRSRSLSGCCPIIWTDALYEKVRMEVASSAWRYWLLAASMRRGNERY